MIDISVLGVFVGSVVVFLSTPGPVTLLVANTGARHGMRSAFLTILGTNAASLLLIAVSFFVLQGLLTVSESVLSWLSIVGGVYLIYLAIDMMKTPVNLHSQEDVHMKNHFTGGFLIGVSNPKDVLFFIAFFPSFFNVASSPTIAISVLTVAWIICDLTVLSLFAFVFKKLINERIAGGVAKISSAILLLIAVYAIWHGLSNF